MPPTFQDDADVEYVTVDFNSTSARSTTNNLNPVDFYGKWVDQASAKHVNAELTASDALRKLYPGHSLVISDDYRLNILSFPGVHVEPHSPSEVVTNTLFASLPRRIGDNVPGKLLDSVIFGTFKATWKNQEFLVHVARVPSGSFVKTVHFILHAGPEGPARDLILSACLFTDQAHDEIWVFNQGFWSKNKALWLELQNSSWDDVVMKEESKKALQKDIYGFFKSEMIYKNLSLPWKRGLITYGPPGKFLCCNGKTISIKVIMKTCAERGFAPLYVKSFQSFQGDEFAMQTVFEKARQMAPCVMILEDIDSLINDRNRSFFLNQLDGLEGNDGLLVIVTTNHLDRLDRGLSQRPSRFDRKYLFDDPDHEGRALYAKYWQDKLKDNNEIYFPNALVDEVASMTQGFSFAYLKEAFVSTLVLISNADDNEHVEFSVTLKSQIAALRKELGKQAATRVPAPLPDVVEKAMNDKIAKIREQTLRRPSIHSREPVYAPAQADHTESILKARHSSSRQLPLPRDVSPEFDGHSAWIFDALSTPSGSPNPSHMPGKIYRTEAIPGRASAQMCVLHAPPSAYPQVAMPGSLPPQDPLHGGGFWNGSSPGGAGSRNPFSFGSSDS
ncbi:P-loop containing nucleoside triphosphate hydrolase protein [Melanogaster broomeanus]|nr:P-loop containing nucleoside triphosphate hydrolase protein [Melanogaster broomeanus]